MCAVICAGIERRAEQVRRAYAARRTGVCGVCTLRASQNRCGLYTLRAGRACEVCVHCAQVRTGAACIRCAQGGRVRCAYTARKSEQVRCAYAARRAERMIRGHTARRAECVQRGTHRADAQAETVRGADSAVPREHFLRQLQHARKTNCRKHRTYQCMSNKAKAGECK